MPATFEPVIQRLYQGAQDFQRVRELLISTYALTPCDWNWEPLRWEDLCYHRSVSEVGAAWEQQVRLWENPAGELVGVAHPDGDGEAALELHPDYTYIEGEMLAWAEGHLACPPADGGPRELRVFVYEYDEHRQHVLQRRGYVKTEQGGVVRRMRLGGKPLPPVALREGYTLRRAQREEMADCQRLAEIVNAAFGRTTAQPHLFRDFARFSLTFCFDLVAEAPDGSLASYVGVAYDAANHRGIFEPVCTHPAHRRRGLAQALMIKGLHFFRAQGAMDVVVGTGLTNSANVLYGSVGLDEVYVGYSWRKQV